MISRFLEICLHPVRFETKCLFMSGLARVRWHVGRCRVQALSTRTLHWLLCLLLMESIKKGYLTNKQTSYFVVYIYIVYYIRGIKKMI